MSHGTSTPLFVTALHNNDPADPRATAIGWASEAGVYGERSVSADDIAAAREIVAHLSSLPSDGVCYVADMLFEEPALEALFACAGGDVQMTVHDWMLALAPFGQARDLAAIIAAVELTEPIVHGAGPAARRMLEVWREARRRWEETQ